MFTILASLTAFAGDTFVKLGVDTMVPLQDSAVDVRIKASNIESLSKHVGVSADSIVSPAYAEAYAGPAFFFGNLTLNVSAGIETADVPIRCATWAYWANERWTTMALAEYGGSGPWFKGLVSMRLGPVSAGAIYQRYDGLGPRLGVSTKKIGIFVAPLYDPEDQTFDVLSGISWTP